MNTSKIIIAATALMFSTAALSAGYNSGNSNWSNSRNNTNTSDNFSGPGYQAIPGQTYTNPEPAPAPTYQPGYRMNKPANMSTSDMDIENKLRTALRNDDTLSPKARSIQVSSENGIVTFTGEVRDDAEKTRIQQLAKQLPGVRSVSNSITVVVTGAPTNPATDSEISDKIRFTVKHDFSLSNEAKNININANDGTVTISGTVKNEMEKMKIESLARSIPGVKNINNKLNIKNN